MANCSTCGARMVHFENPSRDICPENHSMITAVKRRQSPGKGDKNVQERPEEQRGRVFKGRKGFVAQPKNKKK